MRRLGRVFRRVDFVPIGFVVIALGIYVFSNPFRANIYNHFVWQAQAFLAGRFAIPWPVLTGGGSGFGNSYFLDVMPLATSPGFGLIPYPPLPAMLLLPFVALFGQRTDAALFAAVLGALNVGLAWRVATRVTADRGAAAAATIFYGFGTVAWYAAMLGSTWFLAHVVAATGLLLSIAVTIDGDRRSTDRAQELTEGVSGARTLRRPIDTRQFVAGLVFGLAALARLTTILGAPFFVFVGGGRSVWRRAFAAGVGSCLAVAVLVAYNLAATGEAFHPAYEYAYRTEQPARPELAHPEWNAEDPRYVPQNAGIMFASLPLLRPECWRSPLDPLCPLLRPDPIGMSLLLTSPGYLLVGGLLLRRRRATGSEPATPAGQWPAVRGWRLDPAASVAASSATAMPSGAGAPSAGLEDVRHIPFAQEASSGPAAVQASPAAADPSSVASTGPSAIEMRSDTGGGAVAAGALLRATGADDAAARMRFERRLIAGAGLATICIMLVNLAHFSQGWVQFGYRFSNDFAPFALVLVALGISRIGAGPVTVVLVALSILVNAWGVYWGVVLRW